MNQKSYMDLSNFCHSILESILGRVSIVICALILIPFIANAQFIKIDIDIPAKTGVSDMEISEQNWQTDYNQNLQELDGSYSLTISSAENLQVLAILKHSDYLINASGIGVKLTAVLAYRNDGKNKPSKVNTSDSVQFPMSNSGLLIDNMKGSPQVLNAYIMVYTTIEKPKTSGTTYTGDILLTIEYN
jgi:hypothetical protein